MDLDRRGGGLGGGCQERRGSSCSSWNRSFYRPYLARKSGDLMDRARKSGDLMDLAKKSADLMDLDKKSGDLMDLDKKSGDLMDLAKKSEERPRAQMEIV